LATVQRLARITMSGTLKPLVQLVARCFPGALFYRQTSEKLVALTIDDVPVPSWQGNDNTDLILDAIARHNARRDRAVLDPVQATFFVIASHLYTDSRHQSPIVKRMLHDGHEVANHGYVDDTVACEHRALFQLQFEVTDQILRRCGSQPIRWYRPARAFYNCNMLKILNATQGYNPRMVLASMIPFDASDGWLGHPDLTLRNMSLSTFPGAILLLHGGTPQRSRNSAKVLEKLLPTLDQAGYRVVSLSQLVPPHP
jgi:peptidoglycan-N-acetylglucosamine deacetylase